MIIDRKELFGDIEQSSSSRRGGDFAFFWRKPWTMMYW